MDIRKNWQYLIYSISPKCYGISFDSIVFCQNAMTNNKNYS